MSHIYLFEDQKKNLLCQFMNISRNDWLYKPPAIKRPIGI